MANNLVTLSAIEKQFAGTPVLGAIDLQITKGDVTVLLGPSGAGKSTLLRCINLLTPPDSGTLQLGDLHFDFHNKIDHKACLALRRQVSIVFQQFHLWPHKTVLENITLAPIVVLKQPRQQVKQRALALLDKVGLSDQANHYPRSLSGGQQQRVAIARALAMQPQLILFDEPTASLDPERVQELVQLIKNLAAEGTTMVIATHEIHFARQVANRVIFMEAGQITANDSAEKLFNGSDHDRFQQFISATQSF